MWGLFARSLRQGAPVIRPILRQTGTEALTTGSEALPHVRRRLPLAIRNASTGPSGGTHTSPFWRRMLHTRQTNTFPHIDIHQIRTFLTEHATAFNGLASLGVIALFYGLYASAIVKSNTITHQDGPMLPETDSIRNLEHFHTSSQTRAGGRSGGRKYAYDGPDGTEYFYVKETFDRERFLRELIIGTIAQELIGPSAPEVIVIQEALEDGTARYHIGSKSMSGSLGQNRPAYTQDLEDWTKRLNADEETAVLPPNGLGVVLAFNALVGNRDTKLANVVTCDDPDRVAYPIDHEATDTMNGRILKEPQELIHSIKELALTTISQKANAADGIDVMNDPNMAFSDDPETLAKIHPIFLEMITDDIESGEINALFHRAATLSEDTIERTLNRFTGIMTDREKDTFRVELTNIREKAQAGLESVDAYQKEVNARLAQERQAPTLA